MSKSIRSKRGGGQFRARSALPPLSCRCCYFLIVPEWREEGRIRTGSVRLHSLPIMARPIVRFENRAAISYLVAYNAVQSLGWTIVFLKLVLIVVSNRQLRTTYATVGGLVRVLQLVGALEVLHACLGLVRSGPITAFMQWAGRAHVLLAVIAELSDVQNHPAVFLTFAAWSITEMVRYPQYGLSCIGLCPRWLTWLRYTAFIVLYPAGVYGEMIAMYNALGPIKKKHLYGSLFNRLFISYDKFIIVLLLVYPLLFLVLYRHMFKQRMSKLGSRQSGTRRGRRT